MYVTPYYIIVVLLSYLLDQLICFTRKCMLPPINVELFDVQTIEQFV